MSRGQVRPTKSAPMDSDPAAERLLRNLRNYAAQGAEQPLADLPGDWARKVKTLGY